MAGRPPKAEKEKLIGVGLRVSYPSHERLAALAAQRDVTVGELTRHLVDVGLDVHDELTQHLLKTWTKLPEPEKERLVIIAEALSRVWSLGLAVLRDETTHAKRT